MRDEEIEVCKLLIAILISKLRNKISAQKWSECEIYIKKWSECEFSLLLICVHVPEYLHEPQLESSNIA